MGIRRNRSIEKRASFGTALWVAALCMNCACASPGRGNPTEATPVPAPQKLASLEQPDHLFAAPTRADRIGRIMAPVTINGRGPFRLIVDTG
ncbi:MAG: hypothetical protein ACJ8MH_06740, partial [Povalibacter sp.]